MTTRAPLATTPALYKVAYSIPEAAAMSGLSVASIRKAIDGSYLTVKYPPPLNKPVILLTELLRWLEAASSERPAS